ncbi:MAG: SH3 domain-containing protein [Candidatus Aminicenantaceae bacterium]
MNRQKKNPFTKQSVVFFVLFFILFFTPPKKASGQETLIRLKVVADQANIRLEPDISSIIIRQVPKGTILNATEKTEEWFSVQLTSKQGAVVSGYVHKSLVIAIDPLPEEKKPPIIPKIRPIELEEDQPTSPFRFTLSITGGGNYARGGDLNLGIKGLADLYEDTFGIQGEGKISSVHLGYVFGLEVSFPLSEMLSWGIGAEHFQGKNNSQVDYSQGESSSVLHVRPNLRATPLSVFLSFNPIPELYVKGGISYYFAQCSYTYLFETDNLTQQWEGKANAQGLGLMGSIGYLKNYSPNLSFFAEIAGRLAKMRGFTGKEDIQDSSGEISTEEGTLYLIQTQVLEDRTHSVLFIRETKPNEAGVIGAEKAQIDFSGISIKIGIRLHF